MRPAQLSLVALGASAFAWAIWSVVTVPDLWHTPAFLLLAVVSVALVASGALLGTSLRTTALWASLSLVGHTLALQLVDAGTAVLYQHLRPAVAPMSPQDWIVGGGLLAYTLVVLGGFARHARGATSWLTHHISGAKVLVILAAWAAISASPLKDLGGFALEIALSTALGVAALGAVVLAAISLPPAMASALSGRLDALLGRGESRLIDPVALGAAAFTTGATALLAYAIWERHPHLSDEISFLFQAKYFANGALAAPGVPVPELFDAYQIQCSVERCISVLQPGWPGLLALGVRAGVPWLVNPILAGINALLFFVFVRELYGTRLARLAVLLLASSPWNLFLGMSMMNHQATLLGALVGVVGTVLAVKRGHPGWALLAGAGAGFTSLMRPLDGVIVAAVSGLPLLVYGTWRRRASGAVLFALGTLALGSVNLFYNRAVTGNPLEFPVTTYVNELWGEGTNNLGFGADRGVYPMWSHMDGFPGHSPFQAVVNAALNVTALQVDLFGWALGSFLPILLLLAWARLKRTDWLMIGWILAINALYSLYWFASGPDFAARYWFLAIIPLVVLTARGLQGLASRSEAWAPQRGRAAVGCAAILLVVQALLVFVPWRSTDKYYRYFNTGPMVREAVEDGRWPPGVYLVRGANQPDYAAAMIYAAPDLGGGDYVFAFDSLADSRDRLMRAYPSATVRWLDGPSVTEDAYRAYSTTAPTQP